MDAHLLKIISVNRDAIATNKGFYYQYLKVLQKWVQNYIKIIDVTVYTEVSEDILEVGDKLVFTQIKCFSKAFSLNSKEIRASLYNFFLLFVKEREEVNSPKFCFETNTSIAPKESLLKAWITNQDNLSSDLLESCVSKLRTILLDELKKQRRRKLELIPKGSEGRELVESAFLQLKEEINSSNLRTFVESVSWNFGNLTPDESISELVADIRVDLANARFNGKPVDILFDAFLSEIYRCSKASNKDQRVLTISAMSDLVIKTEQELESYVDKRLVDLFNSEIMAIHASIDKLKNEQQLHAAKIRKLELSSNSKNVQKVNKHITLLPFIRQHDVIGRSSDSSALHLLIKESKHVLLSGVGGIGKTTLAKLYLNTYKSAYDHLIWISAGQGLKKAIVFNPEILQNLGMDMQSNTDIEQRFVKILHELNKLKGNNLIIIDNFVGTWTELEAVVRLDNWGLLLTSRSLFSEIPSFIVDPLSFSFSKELFDRYCQNTAPNDDELKEFFELTSCNTLVIELTAKTISNSVDLSLDSVLRHFKEQRLDDRELQVNIEHSQQEQFIHLYPFLLRTFELSNLSQEEEAFLECLAVFGEQRIKLSDLAGMWGKNHEKQNKTLFANLAIALDRKGWIEKKQNDINIHSLIREMVIYKRRSENSPFIFSCFFINGLTRRLTEGYASDPNLSMRFLPYGQSALSAIREPYRASIYQPLLMLENEVLHCYEYLVLGKETLDKRANLVKRAEFFFKNNEPQLGVIQTNFGLALFRNGDTDAALTNFLKAEDVLKAGGEATALQLLELYNNLAMLYAAIGDFVAYKKTHEQSMELRQRFSIKDRRSIAMQSNSMAIVNQQVGNHDTAIELFELAIEEHLSISPQDRNDIELIQYYNNLGFSLSIKNQKSKAIIVLEKALLLLENYRIRNKWFVQVANNLIQLYKEVGKATEATRLEGELNKISSN